jgi:polar amino acid transport system substrate-binding protein
MKKTFLIVSILSAFAVISGCNKEDVTGKKLRIICEEYRPYNYTEDGELKGISSEIVAGILGLMDIDKKTIEITSDWDAALEELKTSDNIALFTTGLSANRADKMQWVGPVGNLVTGFVGLKTSGIEVNSINEAKDLPSVGVITGYFAAETLQKKGFTNLVYFATMNKALTGLYSGSVSTLFDVTDAIWMSAAAEGKNQDLMTQLFVYSTTQAHIAFSPGVSPKLVAAWQEKLDQLKREGYVQEVYDKYLPGTQAPGIITFYTEENPPQNYRNVAGTITGSTVELVEAMMDLTEMPGPFILTTWDDAMDNAAIAPNSIIFSTVRNTERETLFDWVGPVCKKSYRFYIITGGSVTLTSMEEAKALAKVGVPEGWAAQTELENLGFTNLQTYNSPEKVFQKLMEGKISAAVLNDISIDYLATATGYPSSAVTDALLLSSGETYLAFSKGTNPDHLAKWQQAYSTIQSNGTFGEIWKRWYPKIDW